ncbi:MAG: NUDIX hydrolase [Patescibacteria group bacterium]|jgi:8-oxo-dGTP diphosphatase
MIKPVVIALIKKGNKYLMTKRVSFDPKDREFYPYVWQFPGGGLEFGETPEETAKREMIEEIGVEIEIVSLIPKVYTEVRHNWQGIFVCFLCKLKNEKSKIILNHEASEYNWFELEQISKLKLMPKTFEMVLEAEKINI